MLKGDVVVVVVVVRYYTTLYSVDCRRLGREAPEQQ